MKNTIANPGIWGAASTLNLAADAPALLKGGAKVLSNPIGAVKAVKNAVESVPYLTKTGTGKAIRKVAEEATKAKKSISGDELVEMMRNAVNKKYLNVKEAQDTLSEITASMPNAPVKNVIVDIGGKPFQTTVPSKLTPSDLLNFRQKISNTFGGKSFFSSDNEKLVKGVAQQARGAVTESLKTLAPKLKKLDKAYSLMSKGIGPLKVGSPAENVARLTAYGILQALGINPLSILKKGASMLPGE